MHLLQTAKLRLCPSEQHDLAYFSFLYSIIQVIVCISVLRWSVRAAEFDKHALFDGDDLT